jgi:hypothetical protein
MTKHKDLGVARGGRPAHQEQAAQQSAEDQVEQSQTTITDHAHTRAIAKPPVNHRTGITTPFRGFRKQLAARARVVDEAHWDGLPTDRGRR